MKYVAAALIALSAPASAEVVSASSNGFEVRETVPLVVPPNVAWSSFANVSQWWDPDHTYSGKSENLSLTLQPGGCFCERFPKGGGIEHMRVTYVEPGKHAVLTGALGPLLYEGTVGVMDVQVKPVAGGAQLTLDYKVAGFASGGADKLAAAVDGVLADQMTRLRTYAAHRPRA
jgi:uncharacterized protein YndB with AHSA1/START domain